VKPHYENLLLDAANNGRLQVCDQFGTVNAISEIYAADRMAALNPKTAPILTLYAKAHHLNQWAAANGDNFRLEDTGAQDVELTTGILLLESLAEQTTGVTHRKKWTPEKLAELASYRATHTMPDTAEKFHISQSRIRELLPSKKLKASPFPGVIHRAK
jgi:hypothetical protein